MTKVVKRGILPVFVFLFFSTCCLAQTVIGNMLKYWNYKKILHDQFVLVGPDCGMSLIANQRRDIANIIWWRDQTAELGWYISLLATEYGLLKRDGQNTDETVEELFYAIEAFNRLDRTAEAYWRHYYRTDAADVDEEDLWCGVTVGTGDLNGFFIRDDISEEFLRTNNDHFQIPDIEALITSCNVDSGDVRIGNENFGECASSFISGIRQGVGPWEVSQDQIIHLLMGFALVAKYVENDVVFEGISLKQEAFNILNRLGNVQNSWILENHVTQDCAQGLCWHEKALFTNRCECGGAILIPWSTGFVEAWCAIIHEFIDNTSGLCELHDEISLGSADYWDALKAIGAGSENILVNTLVAIGNSWGENTQKILYNRSINNDTAYFHLPLLHRVLWGDMKDNDNNSQIPDWLYDYAFNLIDIAPCDGVKTCKECPKGSGGYEWSTNIFRSRQDRGEYETGTSFPGYDFMLLYNMLRLAKPEKFLGLPYSKNLHVAGAFPFFGVDASGNSISIGSKTIPLPFIGYDTLTANCQILEDGDITFQAGKEIVLQDGFEVKEGANFEAFIEPFECAGGTGKRGTNQNLNEYTSWRTRINVEQIVSEEIEIQEQNKLEIFAPNVDNYPNPINQLTNFTYTINESQFVTLIIRNLYGNKVACPINNKPHSPGCYKLSYNASNLSPGIYYYTLQAGDYVETRKMVIVK